LSGNINGVIGHLLSRTQEKWYFYEDILKLINENIYHVS